MEPGRYDESEAAAVGGADEPSRRRDALRRILAFGLLATGGSAIAQRASGPGGGRVPIARAATLPLATDLAADAATAARERRPIVLFFDRDDCPYCEQALREYLVPMSREGAWKDAVLYRQVEIDAALPLVDFAGAATTHRALAARYRVTLSPTVLVVDPHGEPLGKPVVGLTTVDFYGAYLQNAFDGAVAKLR